MDKQRFKEACEKVISAERERNGIGTLGEKTLHAVMKQYFEPDVTNHEVRVGSFVADIVTADGIIEIQTRAFNALRRKLADFLDKSPVMVVYPLPKTKWLIWINEQTGEVTKKRKSPKQGSILDAVYELYRIKPIMSHPNFKLCIALVDMEEYRYLNGWSRDKKRGSTRYDRIPVDIVEEVYFSAAADYLRFIPADVQGSFTTKDLKDKAKTNLRTAQTALNILYYLGVVRRIGKKGNMQVYERVQHKDVLV